MYSIVMLMAVSSGGEVADCHFRHRCHGCCGGCSGCCGGCSGGCVGCVGCVGCAGGGAPAPQQKPPAEEENQGAMRAAPARLIVTLPPRAKLTINGTRFKESRQARRAFVSPTLAAGREFFYNLQVVVERDGRPVKIEKRVAVRAGAKINVDLAAQASLALR